MRKFMILGIFLTLLAVHGSVGAGSPFDTLMDAVVTVQATVPSEARTAGSLGTEREGNGVVIDGKGLVLTIGYIILEADNLNVVLADGSRVSASLVAYDHDSGFGLLRTVQPLPATPVQLGVSADLQVGDPVMVLSAGGGEAVQGATVIYRGEFVGYWEYLLESAIYTMPSHDSFAGAALIGRDGRLLGIGSIYTQMAVRGVGAVPCNMFVPIDLLKPILQDLIRQGRSALPERPWLGMHLHETFGRVIVQRLSPGGPSEKAGLHVGDVILEVDEVPVTGLGDLFRKVWAIGAAGVEVPLNVLQGTQIRKVTVKSASRRDYLRIRPVHGIKSGRFSFMNQDDTRNIRRKLEGSVFDRPGIGGRSPGVSLNSDHWLFPTDRTS